MSIGKGLAKAAREALDRGDHATALRLADTGLSDSEGSVRYMLLVLKAAALAGMGDVEGAHAAYTAAGDMAPGQALAWQGLAALHAETPVRAIPALERLVAALADNPERLWTTRDRLANAYVGCDRLSDAVAVLRAMMLSADDAQRYGTLARLIDAQMDADDARVKAEVALKRGRIDAPPVAVLEENARTEAARASGIASLVDELFLLCIDGCTAKHAKDELLDAALDTQKRTVPLLSGNARSEAAEALRKRAKEAQTIHASRVLADLSDVPEDGLYGDSALHTAMSQAVSQAEACAADSPLRPDDAHDGEMRLAVTADLAARSQAALDAVARARALVSSLAADYCGTYPRATGRLGRAHALASVSLFAAVGGETSVLESAVMSLLRESDALSGQVCRYALRVLGRYAEASCLGDDTLCDRAWDLFLQGRWDDAVRLLSDSDLECNTPDTDSVADRVQSARHYGRLAYILLSLSSSSVEHAPLEASLQSTGEAETTSVAHSPAYAPAMEAARADSRAPLPFFVLGRLYVRAGDTDRGARCLARALANDPSWRDAALALAEAHAAGRRFAEAVAALEGAAGDVRNARDGAMWRALAVYASKAGLYARAISAWQSLLRVVGTLESVSPSAGDGETFTKSTGLQATAMLGLAEAYRRTGRLTAAAKILRAFGALHGASTSGGLGDLRALLSLAAVECDMGRYDDACDRLVPVLALLENARQTSDGCVAMHFSDGEALYTRCLAVRAAGLAAEEDVSAGCIRAAESRAQRVFTISHSLFVDGRGQSLDSQSTDLTSERHLPKQSAADDCLQSTIDSARALAAQCLLRTSLALVCAVLHGRELSAETLAALGDVGAAVRLRLADDVCSAAEDISRVVLESHAEAFKGPSSDNHGTFKPHGVSCGALASAALAAALYIASAGTADEAPVVAAAWTNVARVILVTSASTDATNGAVDACLEHAEPDRGDAPADTLLVASAAALRAGRLVHAQHYVARAFEVLPQGALSAEAGVAATAVSRTRAAAWTLAAAVYARLGAADIAAEACARAAVDAAAFAGGAWFLAAAHARSRGAGHDAAAECASRLSAASFAPAHGVYGLSCALPGGGSSDEETAHRVRLALVCAGQFLPIGAVRIVSANPRDCQDAVVVAMSNGLHTDSDPSQMDDEERQSSAVEEALRALERDGVHAEHSWRALGAACAAPQSLDPAERTLVLDWLAARVPAEVAKDVCSPVVAAHVLSVWTGVHDAEVAARSTDDDGPGAKALPDDVGRTLRRTIALFDEAALYGVHVLSA